VYFLKNRKALYTIRENGQEKYFATDTVGGYSFPLLVYNGVISMRRYMDQSCSFGRATLADMVIIARGNEMFPHTADGQYLFCSLDETEMITRMEEFSARPGVSYMITLDFDAKEIRWEPNPNMKTGTNPVVMPWGALNTSFGLRRSFMTEADKTMPDIEYNELFVKRFIQKYTDKPHDETPKPEPAKTHFNCKRKKQRNRNHGRGSGPAAAVQ